MAAHADERGPTVGLRLLPCTAVQECINCLDEQLLVGPPLPDAVDLQSLVTKRIEAHRDCYRVLSFGTPPMEIRDNTLALNSPSSRFRIREID